ncbi:MAG: hypothetical protein M3Q71_13420 [Chloroflexota bacterium]|nr:hypothetical protein [Chloroflexota bacterium]
MSIVVKSRGYGGEFVADRHAILARWWLQSPATDGSLLFPCPKKAA